MQHATVCYKNSLSGPDLIYTVASAKKPRQAGLLCEDSDSVGDLIFAKYRSTINEQIN